MPLGNQFSKVFGVDPAWMKSNQIFDPTLDIDAPLFIDPFLLAGSVHKEFSVCAFDAYEAHFSTIYTLLRSSQQFEDKPWQVARQMFRQGEIAGMHGTCLGYSKNSTHGHAFGKLKAAQSVAWAKEVIDLGVKDPELFLLLPLFEGGIGPDLISDMVANISLDCILSFNERIFKAIKDELNVAIKMERFLISGRECWLPANPFEETSSGIILLSADILKNLPIMDDPRLLGDAIEKNKQIRDRTNNSITEIFKVRHKKERDSIKKAAMLDATTFQTLLDLLKIVESTPYDLRKDPAGLMQWRAIADAAVVGYNLSLEDNQKLSPIDRIDKVVIQIIAKFKDLVENNRLSRVFHVDFKPRPERFAQLLFFAVAESFCTANGLDISPESDAGAGPVDFKISHGTDKVVVEIKLSTNSKTVTGYVAQLNAYIQAEKAARGHYVIIDVGKLGTAWQRVTELSSKHKKFAAIKRVHLIDGTLKVSASNLKMDTGDEDDDDDE